MSISLMVDNADFVLFDTKVDAQLYDALMKKNCRKVLELCQKYSDGPFYTLTKRKDTVLHLALYSMQVDLVLSLLHEDYVTPDQRKKMNHQNSSGNTILHEAATQDNCIAAARRIMELEPQLLSIPNKKGEPPIYRAVRYGQMDMFKFLNRQVEQFFPVEEHRTMFYKNKRSERASKKKKATSGTSKNKKVDPTYTILHISIYNEHFELAHYIAKKFPYLVGEKNQYGMTGLQILSMNPSAFRNRDQGCLKYLVRSPPLALSCRVPWWDTIRKERLRYEAAVILANFLIEEDTAWIHEQDEKPKPNAAAAAAAADDDDNDNDNDDDDDDEVEKAEKPPTPLILATKWGCLEIVREILSQHPQTVEQVGHKYGSILHVAIKYRRIEIFDMVLKMEMPMRRLVRKNDRNNNSILHMVGETITDHNNATAATSTLPWDLQQIEYETRSPAFELQDDLLLFERVEGILKTHYHKNVNSKGQTADQVFAMTKEKLRENAQEWLKRTAENCSIVAVLIATVAFAAAYTVPGGSNPDGSPVLINQTFFVVFTISDVLSLTFTLTAVVIFLSILTSSFRFQDFKESLPQKLMLGLTCLILSVTMMMLAFAATIILMIKNKEQWTKIALYTVAFLPVTILAVSYLPLYVPLMRTFHYTLVKIRSFFPRFIAPDSRHHKFL